MEKRAWRRKDLTGLGKTKVMKFEARFDQQRTQESGCGER